MNSLSEMLFSRLASISLVSGVILPKISISRDICPLINLTLPFLIAMTLFFSMSLVFYPLKKALAEAVSSATMTLAI